MDFKNCKNSLVQEEFKQVKKWILENPDKATNLILNFYCNMFEIDIDFQTDALPAWLEIKKMKGTRELPPSINFNGSYLDVMKKLNDFNTEKDFKDYMHLKIKEDKDDN